ncbi:hypothetical protein CLJ1_4034 [Pseudomonas paraeruginosa]|nr:hypothetical protein CLJ1_4034 [Pseudomonas aeruginosa]
MGRRGQTGNEAQRLISSRPAQARQGPGGLIADRHIRACLKLETI